MLGRRLVVIVCLISLLLGCFAAVRLLLVVVTVEGISMLPSLKSGDRVLVLRLWPSKWLRRGQVVLVLPTHALTYNPDYLARVGPFIKRIIGLPGETLVTHLDDISDAYRAQQLAAHDAEGRRVWRVASNHIFVRGDLIPSGFDSLSWGPIPVDSIRGVVIMKLPRKN